MIKYAGTYIESNIKILEVYRYIYMRGISYLLKCIIAKQK
jgi:hypothetical protein